MNLTLSSKVRKEIIQYRKDYHDQVRNAVVCLTGLEPDEYSRRRAEDRSR